MINGKDKAIFQELIDFFCIKDFKLVNIDEMGNEGTSMSNNTQKLILTFPNNTKLVINTWCSGCLENTGFSFEKE